MKITTQKQVETVPAKATPYALGANLYLDVRGEKSRAWLFIWKQGGKNQYAGLGSATGAKGHKVTLVEARRRANDYRAAIDRGEDPRIEEKRHSSLLGPYADAYVETIAGTFRSAKTAYSWRLTFTDHANDLRDIPVATLSSADILAVLKPLWFTKRETARRLRQRLERVLKVAKGAGLRSGDNPATLENLGLPQQQRRGKVRHHPAMPYETVPAFMAGMPDIPGLLPLRLIILTATRTGEAVGARWGEFDMKERLWTIPAWRVKTGSDHHVPLTDEMLSLLALVPRKDGEDGLFPDCGATDTLKALQKLPGCAGFTVHGFRSSFRDWCGNETAFAREIVEESYGHLVGDEAERAYRRQKALKKRRLVLKAWNGYVCGARTMRAAA